MDMDIRYYLPTVDLASALGVSRQAITYMVNKHDGEMIVPPGKQNAFLHPNTVRSIAEASGHRYEPKAIAFQFVKGGVGKSSLAFNFGVRAAQYGYRVLFLDFDHQANLTDALGVYDENNKVWTDWINGTVKEPRDLILKVSDNISIVPSDMRDADLPIELFMKGRNIGSIFRKMIDDFKKDYDLIVCDCPPALGQHVTGVYLAVDHVIAPVNPDKFSASSLRKMTEFWEKINREYGDGKRNTRIRIIINRFDPRIKVANERVMYLMEKYSAYLSPNYIKTCSDFATALETGKHLWELKKSTSAVEIDLLVREELNIGFSKSVEPQRRQLNTTQSVEV